MTNDEVKTWLEIVRDDYLNPRDAAPTNEALSIALWWAEREQHIARLMELVRAADLMRIVSQLEILKVWEREHPRPDSRPPMSDDGPGNTL